jgi:hypothetical protein
VIAKSSSIECAQLPMTDPNAQTETPADASSPASRSKSGSLRSWMLRAVADLDVAHLQPVPPERLNRADLGLERDPGFIADSGERHDQALAWTRGMTSAGAPAPPRPGGAGQIKLAVATGFF